MTNLTHTGLIAYFVRRHKRQLMPLALIALLVGVLEAFNLALFIPIFQNLGGAGDSSGLYPDKALIASTYAVARVFPFADPLVAFGFMFLGLTLVKGFVSIFHEYLSASVTGKILHEYRVLLARRYADVEITDAESGQVGSFVYDVTQPPIMLARMLYTVPRITVDALRFLFTAALFFYFEPRIMAIGIVVLVILYFGVIRRLSVYTYTLGSSRRKIEKTIAAIVTEWAENFRPIAVGLAEKHWLASLDEESRQASRVYKISSSILASPRHVLEMMAFFLIGLSLLLSYVMAPSEFQDSLTVIGFLSMGILRVLPSVAALARAPLEIRSTIADVEYVYRQVNVKKTTKFPQTGPFLGVKKEIRFENITFVYPGRKPTLQDVSATFKSGTTTAIIGMSGSGKSTLIDLLMGVLKPSQGRVLFDGVDIQTYARNSVFETFGYVGQRARLLKGSIRENISFFKSDVTDDEIIDAAKIANIDAFIQSLPSGYDSLVGETGVGLSGGQAQRIAIARALVRRPAVLVFDEPTSALDSEARDAVMSALRSAAVGRTMFLVTHHMDSIPWADNVLKISPDGEITLTYCGQSGGVR